MNGNYFENIQHTSFTYIFIWVRKLDLTALQRRRIEVTEMKLLRPLAGYTLYGHKTNDYIRHELRITDILDNDTTTDHKAGGEQLEDRRSFGACSCNSGDGTDQRVQSLMFMMMMMMMMMISERISLNRNY